MADTRVLDAICDVDERDDKWLAAICAAPRVLQAAGVLAGRTVTSHPSVRDELTVPTLSDERVVVDGRLVTSQGPGTAFEFALALLRNVEGTAVADRVAAGLVLPR
jgi:putative intracellular protease/amidase